MLTAILSNFTFYFYLLKDEDTTHPVYIEMDEQSAHVSTEFKGVAEGEVVSVVDDVTTAVACYISMFVIFHLQYIPELVETIAFYQYGVLKIDDQTGIHMSVLSLLARLTKKRSLSQKM